MTCALCCLTAVQNRMAKLMDRGRRTINLPASFPIPKFLQELQALTYEELHKQIKKKKIKVKQLIHSMELSNTTLHDRPYLQDNLVVKLQKQGTQKYITPAAWSYRERHFTLTDSSCSTRSKQTIPVPPSALHI